MGKCPDCGKEIPEGEHSCPECGLTIPQGDATFVDDRTMPGGLGGPPEEKALAEGYVLGGRYEILGTVGKGGMGWVYKARDREIDRTVALKVIRQDLARDENVIKRFRDEIILARKVTHKNVLRIYDISEAEGTKFISMPFIEGKDLKEIIRERGPLPVDEALTLSCQVLEALRSAHDAGVIHRDLKPQNIMLTPEGDAVVADFGIAKSAEAGGLTVTGQIVGTPEYMSPEQAEGKEVDYRSDVYSFGLVLYEMLTGEVPFKADSIISTLMQRLRETPRAPSLKNPKVPKWVDRLVLRALERSPADRYSTAEDMLADIQCRTVKPRFKLKRRMMVVAAVVAAVAAAVGFYMIRRPKLVMESERTYLAVLPFQNMTSEGDLDWLSSGIPDNLTADLAQSKFFRVMSPGRLRQVVREIGRDISEIDSPEAIDLLARATDLDAVILGSYIKSGDKIRITMKVESAADQEIIGTSIVEDTESALLGMIDNLTRETKVIFNLTQEEIDQDLDGSVGRSRTRSVTAASEFSKGLEFSYSGSNLEAAQAFEAAIEADPDFAMAYAKASEAYKNLGYDDKAERLSFIAVDKVVKFMDRVLPADRTFIMANHADITHNTEQAIQSYQEFTEAYPDDPEGYYKLGITYESVSDYDLAAENLRRALEIDPKYGSARFELGKVLILRNELDAALVQLRQALDFYRSIGNREGEATVLNAMGVLHRRNNEFDEAISDFEASIAIKEELGDRRGIAASLGNLGLVYEITGEREDALRVLRRSLEIKRKIGDKRGISTALNKLGQIFADYGRYDEALSHFERGYEIREEVGSKKLMASSLSDIGRIYSMMGRYEKAVERDSMALALRVEIGDRLGEAHSLRNIAEVLTVQGHFNRAMEKLRRAAEIDLEMGDNRFVARDKQSFGQFCLARGKVDSALIYLGEALTIQESLDEAPAVAVTLSLMGEAHLHQAEYLQALGRFERVLTIAEEIGEQELLIDALLGKARLYFELGYAPGCDSVVAVIESYDETESGRMTQCRLILAGARRLYGRGDHGGGLAAARRAGEMAGTEDARCGLMAGILEGRLLAAAGRIDEARSALERAIDRSGRLRIMDLNSEGMMLLSRLAAGAGRGEEAEDLASRALETRRALGLTRYDYLIAAAEADLASGDDAGAVDVLEQALSRAGEVYSGNCPPRLRRFYLEHKRIPYRLDQLSELLAETGGTVDAAGYKSIFGLN
jgi:serine/threonine protein kinase/tetratricopeptide (TPR) repeat protein